MLKNVMVCAAVSFVISLGTSGFMLRMPQPPKYCDIQQDFLVKRENYWVFEKRCVVPSSEMQLNVPEFVISTY